jgi:DNA-binding SARP family transcriptional activator
VEEFLQCFQHGQRKGERRIAWFERAYQLYRGPLLPEDIYSDWSYVLREQCALAYLAMANDLTAHYMVSRRYEDALRSAHAVLKENRCDETAHRHLILIYSAQGRRSEALQQYQRCELVLREELGVKPMPETDLVVQTLLSDNSPSAQQ